MKFFNPDDFNPNRSTIYGDLRKADEASKIANEKLEREGKVIRNTSINGESFNQGWSTAKTYGDTHQALLINIESLDQCDHPIDHFIYTLITNDGPEYKIAYCSICGTNFKLEEIK